MNAEVRKYGPLGNQVWAQMLTAGDTIRGATDLAVETDGFHSCFAMDRYKIGHHEAGAIIVRPCQEPIVPGNFIPEKIAA